MIRQADNELGLEQKLSRTKVRTKVIIKSSSLLTPARLSCMASPEESDGSFYSSSSLQKASSMNQGIVTGIPK